jgi:hypothetical protein
MRRSLSLVLAAAFLAALPAQTRAEGAVDDFIDSLQRTLTRPEALTARASCRTYAGGVLLPRRLSGIVTFCDESSPFFLATMSVEDAERDGTLSSHSVLVAESGDSIAVADGVSGFFYKERTARTGAHLLSSRLDVVFLLLRYPQLFDSFRGASGTVADEVYGSVPARRLVVDGGMRHLEVVVDAVTGFPLRIDRTRIDPDRPGTRTVLELSEYKVSSSRPPESLFDVNALFGFPERRYDPTGLFTSGDLSGVTLRMLDGSEQELSGLAGKWVFLCFHSEDGLIRGQGETFTEKAGDLVRSRGGVFIDVYAGGGTTPVKAYKPAFAAKAGNLPSRLGLDRAGLPSILVIGPDGSVREQIVGYIPSVTEKELDGVIASVLPQAN